MTDASARRYEDPPFHVEHRSTEHHGRPFCGACGKELQDKRQNRCPYLACGVWLRTAGEIERSRKRAEAKTERPAEK